MMGNGLRNCAVIEIRVSAAAAELKRSFFVGKNLVSFRFPVSIIDLATEVEEKLICKNFKM